MSDVKQIQVSGAKLKRAREAHGLELSEAARLIGHSRQYLWNIENNKQKPGADALARLCALYQTDISSLTNKIKLAPAA